jgi:hypothetical protein
MVGGRLRAFAPFSAAALSIAFLVPAPAQAQGEAYPSQEDYVLRVEYREFRPGLQAEVVNGTPDKSGTLLDLTDDLGVEDDRTYEIRGAIQVKRGHKLRFSYTPLDYKGEVEEASQAFTYGSTDFQRFDRVVSSFKGAYAAASYEWDFVKGARGYLGGVFGARMLDIDALVSAPDKQVREVNTVRTYSPVVGVATRMYAGRMSLESEFVGFSMGSRGSVWEFDMSGRLHISDRLAVEGGYRSLSLKGEDGPDNGEIKLKGWNFGLELSL